MAEVTIKYITRVPKGLISHRLVFAEVHHSRYLLAHTIPACLHVAADTDQLYDRRPKLNWGLWRRVLHMEYVLLARATRSWGFSARIVMPGRVG